MTSRRVPSAAVLAGYGALSLAYFGVRVLPHPGRSLVGSGADPQIFVWSLAWWPHALGAGQNPFLTHTIWAPDGLNLAWTTTVPGLALAFAPVTVLFGPIAAYDTAAVLMPALAAWTAFLLCRHLTGAVWPSLAGGYLFGFSGYMLGQELGHLHMTSVLLVPLVALAVIRFVEGGIGRAGLAWRLGGLVALQLSFSTELAFTLTLALAAALVLAYATVPDARPRLRALPAPLAGGYALGCAIASPLLWYAAQGFESTSINLPQDFPADLLNLVVPTRLVAAGAGWAPSIADRFAGGDAERGAYLGVPVLLVVAWFAWRGRRRPAARFLVGSLLLADAAALGTVLEVDGHRLVTLPWAWLARLPGFDNVLPVRLSLFASLAAAVIVALWARDRAGRPEAVVLPALAVLALVPAVWLSTWSTSPEQPAFFTDGLYRQCLRPDDNVIVVPYGGAGPSMLWQAESGFAFRMAGGYLRPLPPASFLALPAVKQIVAFGAAPDPADLRAFVRAKDVTKIVVSDESLAAWDRTLSGLGSPTYLGGVAVYPHCL